ncbi:MAG: hypothetical protein OER96_03825 [Gammaproteobacteria bacterium]|nr:hypothetical protein [Gammaproteobacteria bacterium]
MTSLVVALLITQATIAQEQPAQSNEATAESQVAQGDRQYQMEHKFEKAEQYFLEFNEGATSEDFEKLRPWLKPFTDVEVMMDMFSDPRKMVQWMNAISEPEAVYLMMKCSTEPVMWDTWMTGLTDVPKLTNAMFRFMDPNMYFNWMTGMMDPQVYTSMLALMDPNKYVRWAEVSANPKFYEPMFAFADPNWYTPRLEWMFNPQTFQPMINMFGIPVPAS